MIDRGRIGEYIDIKRYGLGVPFGSFSLALGLLMFTAPGVTRYHALTVYGKIGVGFLVTVIVALFVVAGYSFSLVDIDDYVRRKEDIQAEYESEQPEETEVET